MFGPLPFSKALGASLIFTIWTAPMLSLFVVFSFYLCYPNGVTDLPRVLAPLLDQRNQLMNELVL